VCGVVLAACPSRDIASLDMDSAGQLGVEITVTGKRDADILFVIDNSDSMREEQVNIAANFPRFIERLDAIQGGRPNIHIGVVSSNVGIAPYGEEACSGNGDNGLLQNTPRVPPCSPPNGGARYIEDIALASGGRQTNYPGQLEDVFACIAQLGTTGCGYEQHLESMKRALDDSNPENANFVRDGAYLAVIIVGDEDDCSARDNAVFNPSTALDTATSVLGFRGDFRCTEFGTTCDGLTPLPRAAGNYTSCAPRGDSYLHHPQDYVDFLRARKGDPTLLLAAAIVSPVTPFQVALDTDGKPKVQPSCNTSNGKAYPAVRLSYFVNQFGAGNGQVASICNTDLSGALTDIAEKLRKVLGTNCLGNGAPVTDIDTTQPGLQLECSVVDRNSAGVETVVPRCVMIDANTPRTDNVPCWWTNVDAVACTDAPHVFFKVERGSFDPPAGTRAIVRCVT
jgi:hypothetical protein